MSKLRIFRNALKNLLIWIALELISPRIEINSGVEADKAERNFTASIDSEYRLATGKVALSDINNDIPGLDRLLNHKRRLKKMVAGNQGSSV
jgi:hypothetical protein